MDHSPDGASLMAICAVSGSIALLALEAYRRLLSDFMKRMEHEIGGSGKSSNRRRRVGLKDEPTELDVPKEAGGGGRPEHPPLSSMPVNRQVLYRGMLHYRNIRGHHMSDSF
ncbi:hypothetical protein SAY87_001337 [Trapa incisa]|uniref:Uncharacterized protein n=1 Tax=Trapa incisa TaxID=236973 RepID=A0AAN7GDF7_9MYRT|nr:hypothetical protein SAY87_001337 [Trapa incisa]